MVQYQIIELSLELREGNIANQPDIEAVVNAANAGLYTGGGVAGAIHDAAGPGLYKECRPLAPIKPGEAVITGAHKLPNQYVIHCLGPVYCMDHPADKLLASCYRNALLLAEEKEIASIAFPAISTGIYGYPKEEAIPIAIETIIEMIPKLKSLKQVAIVLYSANDYMAHKEYLSQRMD
jgi:O-acetyl-ADP-ribose deacetylase